MSRNISGPEIERLIQYLGRIPGLGPRSARRAALQLIKKKEQLLVPLAQAITDAVNNIVICNNCGNIDTRDPCTILPGSEARRFIFVCYRRGRGPVGP